MDRKQAVLTAADHIEQHPETYEFMKAEKPSSEQDITCVLGWIGHYMDIPNKEESLPFRGPWYPETVAQQFVDVLPFRFSTSDLSFYEELRGPSPDVADFWDNTEEVASRLRLFAEKL